MGSTVSATEFSFLSDIHSCGCFVICAVAAKKNGPPTSAVAAAICRVRFYSSSPQRRMVSPAERHYHSAASILDFGPRLGNRCKVSPGNVIHRASILNFRARFGSRCKLCRVPGRSSRGPLQRWDLSRSRAARRATIPFCGVRPRESKLSTAWPPKRNQHRLCDADSLIISALRWVRDSNPRSDRSLTCFRGRLLQPLGQLTLDRQISYKFLKYQSCRGNAFNFSNLAIYFIQSLEELQFRKWWILINPKTFVS